jgi:hypothetical protein
MSVINGLVNQFGQAITKPIPIISANGAAVSGAQAVGDNILIDRLYPPHPFKSDIGGLDSNQLKLDYMC